MGERKRKIRKQSYGKEKEGGREMMMMMMMEEQRNDYMMIVERWKDGRKDGVMMEDFI